VIHQKVALIKLKQLGYNAEMAAKGIEGNNGCQQKVL